MSNYVTLVNALQALASVCDGAQEQDGMGFNGRDTRFGKDLAAKSAIYPLTENQQRAAIKMLQTYRGQLSGKGIELPTIDQYQVDYTPQIANATTASNRSTNNTPGTISADGSTVCVKFNAIPSQTDRDWMKGIKGWQYNGATRCWSFPIKEIDRIIAKFNQHTLSADLLAQRDAALAQKRAEEDRQLEITAKLLQAVDLDAPLPNGRTLFQHQKDGVARMLTNRSQIVADDMGLGKAQPLTARLLTPNGFITMGDVKVGDLVFGSDGKPHNVMGVYPQGIKSVYKVTFSDGCSTECCEDHLWSVREHNSVHRNGQAKVLELKQFANRLRDGAGNRRYRLPTYKPIEFQSKELPLDPYLLGALIGNGHLGNKGHMSFSSADQDTISQVDSLLPKGVSLKYSGEYDYRMTQDRQKTTRNPLKQSILALNLNCGSGNKFIPEEYKYSSIDQRISLLQGLMDTDGYISMTKGTAVYGYCTVSEQLCDDVVFLVQSLGGKAIKSSRSPWFTYKGERKQGKIAYRINMSFSGWFNPFRCERKAKQFQPREKYAPVRMFDKVEYVGEKECQCIMVDAPDHLYMTDHCILTHNTTQALVAAKAWQIAFDYPILVICPASLKDNWFREAAGVGVQIEVFSWAKLPEPLEKPYVLIADECFPAGTKVSTALGEMDIDHIVENKLDIPVASCRTEYNVLEYKKIVRWIKKPYKGRLVKIVHDLGEVICTPNHKVYLEGEGYVRADSIRKGVYLRKMQEGISEIREGKCSKVLFNNLQEIGVSGGTDLPIVRKVIRLSQGCQPDLLLQAMREQINCQGTGILPEDTETWSGCQGFSSSSRLGCKNEGKQPHEEPRNIRENAEKIKGENFSKQGWQWAVDRTTKEAFQYARGWMGDRVSHLDGVDQGAIPLVTPIVQSGLGQRSIETSHRDRRENSQVTAKEAFGSQENSGTECVRVVGVEILEPGSDGYPGSCDGENFYVYNLEVEDNHNYFAAGILVSNCHYAQAGNKSQRGKAFLDLSLNDQCVACYPLTGTPIKNGRPVNLFPLLKAVKAEIAQDKKAYEKRYCNAGPTRFSQWDTSGASHLDELHVKCKPYMIRRTKKECLDLPAKIRTLRHVEMSVAARKAYDQAFADMRAEYKRRLAAGEISDNAEALVMLTHLRRAGSIAKVESAIEMAEEILEQGNSVVLFTEFVESAESICKALSSYGAELLTGNVTGKDGDTGLSKRQTMVDRFQAKTSRVFVSTIRAGGVGITLTAASDVLLVDRPWTPGDAEQAEDRCHRIGQASTVNTQWLQANGVDEKIDQLLLDKSKRISLVLEGERKTMRGTGGSVVDVAKELLSEIFAK